MHNMPFLREKLIDVCKRRLIFFLFAYLTFRQNSEAYIEAVQDFLVDNTSPFSSAEVKFLS